MTTRIRFATWAAIAGAAAVVVAGVVAIVVVDRSLHQVVDDRLDATAARLAGAGSVDAACGIARTVADDPQGRVIAIVADGQEQCRSAVGAPSPRALGVSLDEPRQGLTRSRDVDGVSWRVDVVDIDGAAAIVGEQDESATRALANAQRAIGVAIGIGILLAVLAGVLAAVPATRRIDRLLDRIRSAAARRGGGVTVAGGLGRDLDRAGASVDELLARLRESESARHRLFADAAHQLRTPVTSIRTNAQLLERRTDVDDEVRDLSGRIARQSAAIGELVAALVDYAAVEAWVTDDAEPLELGALARDAAERVAIRWPDVHVEVAADESRVVVDPELVVRAIGNLLDNAVVHGEAPIRAEVARGRVTVQDAGGGIAPSDTDRVFEPFASGAGGTGLGLAFVAHVARVHGGSVAIEAGPPTRIVLDLSSTLS